MLEYKIIRASAVHGVEYLQKEVNEHLEFGWQLYGNLVVDNGVAYQTIVRIRR